MPAPATDRNLLFGVMALQMDFVTGERLVAAIRAWAQTKSRPLGQVFLDRGDLDASTVELLNALVDKHVAVHGGDARSSLDSLSVLDTARELLSAVTDTDVQAWLATPAADSAVSTIAEGAEITNDQCNRTTRRYRTIRPHARGGLGEIFIAEDMELHREVALKEIQNRHAGNRDCRDRFVQEAEITGGLEHPGVVPVYGLGAHRDGRPYYAMRLVRGQTLQAAVKDFHNASDPLPRSAFESLTFRRLLGRVVAVCEAVAYAHSRGVLHRDLKPSNIMLGKFGETLVVDWGLAKPIGREPGSSANADPAELTLRPGSGSAVATADGQVLGTPAYMSPEQAAGQTDGLRPASDVYSLGATLYSVLTGLSPFSGSAEEVLAKVRAAAFSSPRQVAPNVPPALEAICLKAMAKQPGERYAGPKELAADVEHWLADEPVAAWAEPWGVRAWRWVRRHRTGVAAATMLTSTLALCLGIGSLLLWQAERKTEARRMEAEEQRARAEELLQLAGQTSRSLLELAEELPRTAANVMARQAVVDQALGQFRQALDERPNDAELRAMTALLLRYSATAQRVQIKHAEADKLYAEASGLLESLVQAEPGHRAHRDQLAEVLRDRSQVLNPLGRHAEAAELLRRSIRLGEALLAEDPGRVSYMRTVALGSLDLAVVEYWVGDVAGSVRSSRQSLELMRKVLKDRSAAKPLDPLLCGAAQSRLAVALREAGSLDEAESNHTEAITYLDEHQKQSKDDATYRFFLARALLERSRTLARKSENPQLAGTVLNRAVEICEALHQRAPRHFGYKELLAITLCDRAVQFIGLGQLTLAESDLHRSVALLDELVTQHPGLHEYRGQLGRSQVAMAQLADSRKDVEGAAAWYGKAAVSLNTACDLAPAEVHHRRARHTATKGLGLSEKADKQAR